MTNRIIWFSLAFQGGCINAGGFLACGRFVSHTTGFATQLGYDIAIMKWVDALGMLTVPLFFLGGSMISAYFVDRPADSDKPPRFHTLFFMICCFLVLVCMIGDRGLFGDFNNQFEISQNYLLMALLCLSSGILNAITTTGSGRNVRTTHLTGHTTDLGISLVKAFHAKDKSKQMNEYRKNTIRILVIGGFVAGSIVSSFLFLQIKYWGFLLPAAISFAMYRVTKKEREIRHA